MEPDVIPLHSSPPPPMENGDAEPGLKQEALRDFGGFAYGSSCSSPDLPGFTDSSSNLRESSPTLQPATHQPNCDLHHPVKKSQPASTVNSGSGNSQLVVEGKDSNNSCVHLTNGYPDNQNISGTHLVSMVGVNTQKEETGFADFTVFSAQPEHPWCCGFTPLGDRDRWDGRDGAPDSSTRPSELKCDPEQEGNNKQSEPRYHSTYQTKERACTVVNHCEKRDTASVIPAQDDRQPQETSVDLDFLPEGPNLWKHESRKFEQSYSSSYKEVQEEAGSIREDQEGSAWTVHQPFSVNDSASDDLASFCDDLSIEGPSADWEPNVSSLASGYQTDSDPTDDEEDELGNYCNYNSITHRDKADLRRTKAENVLHYCHQPATQETPATSSQLQPGMHTEDSLSDCKDDSLEPHVEKVAVQIAEAGMQSLQTLPPSDSFADFCSAPMQEDEERLWTEFNDQKAQQGGRTGDQVSSLQTDGGTEEDSWLVQSNASRRNSCQASLSCCVQQLLLASFPAVEIPVTEDEQEVPSLGALEEVLQSSASQWAHRGVWRPQQDLHTAVGLQFQWGGSHTNTTLLRCLGVDPKNIVFTGATKHSMSIPALSSSLGKLEVTQKPVCSSGRTPTALTDLMQEALPSSPDWSSRGLGSSQDGTSPRRGPHF
ncbi:aftiphilin isoform X2 [Antennarius striatus]|uniref:aftiphilin isoform X2 n=1 Tax=Antennarius striatus TaxID=241820 RepID=UPI0035B03645